MGAQSRWQKRDGDTSKQSHYANLNMNMQTVANSSPQFSAMSQVKRQRDASQGACSIRSKSQIAMDDDVPDSPIILKRDTEEEEECGQVTPRMRAIDGSEQLSPILLKSIQKQLNS